MELSEEEAAACFAQLNKSGELADEELDNVAGGGCHAPAGAYARLRGGELELTAFLGGEAGGGVRRTVCGPAEEGETLARRLAQELRVSLAEGGTA